jgi:hypothetical protein
MKKIASIAVLSLGLVLLSLNYIDSNYRKANSSATLNKAQKQEVLVEAENENLDATRINLPSIFNALIGLL